ncbi:MAG: DMT family transporter [Oscillospiraceae bacterium]|nr:DMT family transporter [Oscillospiraceae bacterium]
MNRTLRGHILALFTVVVWGTTFIVSKVLLRTFTPTEIILFRFSLGYLALWLAAPRAMKVRQRKHELYFAAAGLFGITLYFMGESLALKYTQASNVGVIIATVPFFTALVNRVIFNDERLTGRFYAGFAVAMVGVVLITFGGASGFAVNPVGDLLAVVAAIMWAFYSAALKKLGESYPVLESTRRMFFYGLLFLIPVVLFLRPEFHFDALALPQHWGGFVYLGLVPSAMCYVTWNTAQRFIGTTSTSNYIYLDPVVTVVASVLLLNENITLWSAAGTVLALLGLVISQNRSK